MITELVEVVEGKIKCKKRDMKKNTPFKVILKNYYLFIRDFFKDLFDDKLGHYASSLSWSTLFSIIPLLAIMLAIFTTLPVFDTVYSKIETLIFSNLMPTDSKEVMQYINTFIKNSGKLGVMGALYVVFAAIMFFKNYDYIVNDIFDAPGRSVLQAVRTYLLLLLIIPAMIGGSFYLSIFLQTYLDKSSITSMIHLYRFIPYLIVWMIFYITYQLFSPLLSILFVVFYPLAMVLHLLGMGDLFDDGLLWIFSLPQKSQEHFLPLWTIATYAILSIGAIWKRTLFYALFGLATGYTVYIFVNT